MHQTRLRVTFAKDARLRYISHLDLVLMWERALRRAEVPLAYSRGHNPQARLQLASGLPLGYTGRAEVMDVILTEAMSPEEFTRRVNKTLPSGLRIGEVEEVPLKTASLQSALRQAVYEVRIETGLPADELRARISRLLAATHLEQSRVRKGRVETFDLRPLVEEVQLEGIAGGQATLHMRLSAGQHGNVRPDAVLAALGLGDAFFQAERTKLLFEFDSL
ncbi:MAG: TIGR03936 family radical SAM-associated protein [Anaerolineae bacterium]